MVSSDNETLSTDSDDVSLSGSDSSWVLSPEQLARHVSPVTCRDRVAVMEMADIERSMTAVSKIRGCKTPGCEGSLVPVQVKSTGLGGALCISFACDGCSKQASLFVTLATWSCSEPDKFYGLRHIWYNVVMASLASFPRFGFLRSFFMPICKIEASRIWLNMPSL